MASYTYVASGTVVTSSSGAAISPVGSTVSSGNLLLLFTGQRGNSNTITSLSPNWTQLASYTSGGSLNLWGRVADGTAADQPSVDWSGTTHCFAWIETYSGDVYADLSTIVAHSGTADATQTPLRAAGVSGVTTADCLLILLSRKNCTAANATTFTAPGSFTKRTQYIANTTHWAASASWQQTTGTDFAVTNWTDDDTANESLATNSLIVALKTQATSGPPLVLPTMYRKPNVLLRM